MAVIAKFIISTLALSTLIACSNKIVNYDTIHQQAQQDAASADESAARTIQHAQSKLELGNSEQLSFYAPRHLKTAREQLQQSQEMHTSGEPDGKVKTLAMTAIGTLEAGLETKRRVLELLQPALDHRTVLLNIKADQYFATDFAALEKALAELINQMEDQQTLTATQGQQTLLVRMHQVEVNTVEYIQLQAIKDHLQRIKEKGGADIAPISWDTAQHALHQAQAIIAKTPRNKSAITQATVAASRAAQHADIITNLSNDILNANSQTAENIALRMERWLYRIGVALKHRDIRHQPLSDQAAEYAAVIETLMRQRPQ